MITNVILVGLGGFCGAVLRFVLCGAITRYVGTLAFWDFSALPIATFCVNALGSFAIGVLAMINFGVNFKLFLIVGLLGGFTTFSTFSYENITLLSTSPNLAILNIVLSIFVCLLFCYCGVILGKNI